MVPELKAVLQLIDEMPEIDQRSFALLMALNIKEQEEKRTMTKGQRRALEKLREKEAEARRAKLYRNLRDLLGE